MTLVVSDVMQPVPDGLQCSAGSSTMSIDMHVSWFTQLSFACCRVDLPAMFGAKGIEHAEERVSLVVGDVMQPFPDNVQKAGIDTLVMKHFLSAFNDKDAILILKHCSQVLAPQGKILLLQVLILPYVAFLFETSLPVFVCAPSHPPTHSCLLGIHQHCMLGRLRQENFYGTALLSHERFSS